MGELLGPADAATAVILGSVFLACVLMPLSQGLILVLGFLAGMTAVRRNWMKTLFRLGFMATLGIGFVTSSNLMLEVLSPGPGTTLLASIGPLNFVAGSPRPGAHLGAWLIGCSALPVRQILRENRQRLEELEEAVYRAAISLVEEVRDRTG